MSPRYSLEALCHINLLVTFLSMGSSSSPPNLGDGEAQTKFTSNRGGWTTFPFMIGTMACLTLAGGGWLSNLIVYLIQEFNISGIDATQIFNIIAGCVNFFPFVCAIIADSFLGCYSVIWTSSFISLLGVIMFLLTSTLERLRPQPCETPTHSCKAPSHLQYSVLYTCLALASLGLGGTRFTMGTMGADQFSKPKERAIYFNWFFFTMYISSVITATVFVYVEDNVSWSLGFSLCLVMNVIGLVIFLMGTKYYKHVKPEGNPFTGLARVVIASIRKRKMLVATSLSGKDFYHGDGVVKKVDNDAVPSNTFRFLNRGAVIREGDIRPDGSITQPWDLCTVQQVEDLKPLIRLIPLWTSSVFLGTPIAIQGSLSVLQALTMDRHIGQHFKFPAGSISVFILLSTSIFLAIFDRFLSPLWRKLVGKSPTPLQLIGTGHVLNVASMAVSAVVELKRREISTRHGGGGSTSVPMSVFWLVPQMVVVGIGEAFHFPGQVALYYQEFPNSLKSLSSAMIALLIGVAFYLGTALVDFVRRVTSWLPNNINDGGKLDYMYWVLVGVGVVNFCYYLVCAWFYKYQPTTEDIDDSNSEQ